MRNFKEAVKRKMEREGWEVHYSEHQTSDLICKRENKIKMIRAKGNGHGHLYQKELKELKKIEKKSKMPILIAKVNNANEIIFIRLEKFLKIKKEKTETHNFTFYEPREMGFLSYENGKFKTGEANRNK